MGCGLSGPSPNLPPDSIEKPKMSSGYAKGSNAEARRSTGRRQFNIVNTAIQLDFQEESKDRGSSIFSSGRTSSASRGSQEKKPITRVRERGPPVGGDGDANNARSGTVSTGRRESQERKLLSRDERDNFKANGSSGSATQRIIRMKNAGDKDHPVDGWPKWLTDNIPKDALAGLTPRSAETYDKIDKVGQGTYSNVYKARDKYTGKVVALKKVRFDTSEPESVKFMAREIRILRKLDHPNILKLEGLATSRMNYSLYLVFDYMQSDLASIISRPDERLTEPQVKCYMHQLLSGLQHCHERAILHRDIKGSNLLIDKKGILKIGDFGLANYYNPQKSRPLTCRVVTLWYRAPELLLGATNYGPSIDLWSVGCLLAEMFMGRPIMPGRTEVEQLHKIFKLCGTPPEDFWRRVKFPSTFRPPQTYKPRLREVFRNFPASSLGLLNTLLALDPSSRGSAASALQDEFFTTSPLACDLSGLPVIHKEEDEPILTTERRKHRRSKNRHQSQSHIDRGKKDLLAEKPGGDTDGSVEPDKSAETIILSQGPASSATSTSSSVQQTIGIFSSATQTGNKVSPPIFASPDMLNWQSSSTTEEYPEGATNIKNWPAIPDAKRSDYYQTNIYKDYIYQMNNQVVQRSLSTRELQNINRKKLLELHAVD